MVTSEAGLQTKDMPRLADFSIGLLLLQLLQTITDVLPFCCHLLKFATFFATSWLLLPFCLLAVVAVATINWLMPSCLQLLKLLCNSQWLIIAVFVANKLLLLHCWLIAVFFCCHHQWLLPFFATSFWCGFYDCLIVTSCWCCFCTCQLLDCCCPCCHQILLLYCHLWLIIACFATSCCSCFCPHQWLVLFLSLPIAVAIFVPVNWLLLANVATTCPKGWESLVQDIWYRGSVVQDICYLVHTEGESIQFLA